MARPITNKIEISAKERILNAAISIIRTKGYSATTVDDLCESAKVSKGTFFHYFSSKENLAVAATEHWSVVTGRLFREAPYHKLEDPLDRFLGYIDFRRTILKGKTSEYTCLVGTMLQEVFEASPEISKACQKSVFGHAESLENDIADAIQLYPPSTNFSPKSLAIHTQAVIQGAFILAKAGGGTKLAAQSIDHLKDYVQLLFNTKQEGRRSQINTNINQKRRMSNV